MERRRPAVSTPRKLTIRPYKKRPKPPSDLFRVSWEQHLRPAVRAVHKSTQVPSSLEELYGRVEDACIHKFAPELYGLLRDTCDKHIESEISSLPLSNACDIDTFLKSVEIVWHRHCTHMLRIRSIFLYLDRTYIVQGAGISSKHDASSISGTSGRLDAARSFWDMGLGLFRKHFSTTRDIQNRTVTGVLKLVDRERDGDAIDNPMLKSLLAMFSAVGTYDLVLEKAFLAATDRYYRAESTHLIVSYDVPSYLEHAERRILEESDRAIRSLDPRTRSPLIATVEKRLVSDHVVSILDKGFSSMCDENRKDDIKRCYNVLSRANEHMPSDSDSAHELMKARLIEYVKGVGRGIVSNTTGSAEKDAGMVQALLDLKARLDDLVTYSFNGADNFHNAVNLAFESFVNARENKPAELIAKFIDGILRTGNKRFTEEKLESTLDKTLILFRFIDGKDVFEAFYKKDLSKRLLYDKSASLDLEKNMISKLKTECGSQFTSKLEAMFRDVDVSKDLMQSFKTHAASRERLGDAVELNVFVLEAGRWPLSSAATKMKLQVKLPQVLMDYHETYKRFYLTKHGKRKLSWQHADGSCTVMGRFPKGDKILALSLYQTIVLVLFNDIDEMSYSDILKATGIDDQELKRTLLSLACGKVRVLSKRPKGPRVEADDSFMFNETFQHRLMRIKVNAIQMKETVEENAATTEKVFKERNYQIDAALVRIMKTRRTLQHVALISEVIQHLRFRHNAVDIKKRIESLIDREYLERDESNAQTYHYLA